MNTIRIGTRLLALSVTLLLSVGFANPSTNVPPTLTPTTGNVWIGLIPGGVHPKTDRVRAHPLAHSDQ